MVKGPGSELATGSNDTPENGRREEDSTARTGEVLWLTRSTDILVFME